MKDYIGRKYIKRGKRKDECTVVDKLTTTNIAGEVVKVRYVTTHEFMGQTITESDVLLTTIKMGLIEE